MIARNMDRLAVRDRGADVFQLLVHDGRQCLKLRVKLCANGQEGMAAMRAQFIDGAVKPFLFLRAQIRPRKSRNLKRRTYRLGQRGNTRADRKEAVTEATVPVSVGTLSATCSVLRPASGAISPRR